MWQHRRLVTGAACGRQVGPDSRKAVLVVASLVAAGCVLRLARPEVHSFWIDEGSTVLLARSADLVAAMRADSHPPLSFLAFRAWGTVFGWSDLALRLLPALASCVSLALFVPLAHAWLGRRRAPWAVALYAFSPLLVWLAHEVRMYALVELATLLVLHAARGAWRRPSIARHVLLAACTALATGLHYYGAFAGLIVIAQALVRRRDAALRWSDAGATAAACALGVAAWAPWLVTILPDQLANDWPRIAHFGWRDVAETPARLVAVDFVALHEHGVAWIGWAVAGLCTLGVCAWIAVALFGRAATSRAAGAGEAREDPLAPREALCAALVPIAAALVLAACAQGGFQPRYLVTAVPGMIACAAGGLASLRPRLLARAAGGLLLCGALSMCVLQLAQNRREDYRSACREIAARWQPGDRLLVVCCVPRPYVMATVEHYLRDRPAVLGSALDLERYLAGGEPVPSGTRIHVIWREATICWQPFDDLRRTHRFLEQAPPRFRIHRKLAEAP